jgi:hypothetical protein
MIGALLAGALFAGVASADEPTVRRFALLAGANDGGPERVPLVYAGTDARTMAAVLSRYGGVDANDILVLKDPVRLELEAAFAELATRIDAAEARHRRTEVVVYYSGHSDASGLLLSGGALSYTDLRASLDALPADVRVAILDSCSSGALVRGKGGVAVPGFLVEEGSDVEGHAFLTSSSADEISQEADALGGSFFTHALVTGLRGGADTDLDGQVTLNEAYRFAYDETLARTEGTRYGPQHAAYDIQLSGSGDLVMTDLRRKSAALELGAGVQGLVMVRDEEGRLVAELRKPAGRSVLLRLDPGAYTVTAREADATWRARAAVTASGVATLDREDFSGFALADARARGDTPAVTPRRVARSRVWVPEWPLGGGTDPQIHETSLGVLATGSYGLDGTALALGGTWVETDADGTQLAIGANFAGGGLSGLQGTFGANVAGGAVSGAQLASGANWAGSLDGFQGSAGVNILAGDGRGAQGGVGANIVGGDFEGFQGAAIANVSESVRGVQFAAGVNVAGQAQGLQAGVVNVSSGADDRGLKLGVVNVSGRLHGGSVGIVNVAEHLDGAPIGLLNLIQDGIFDAELWADSTATWMGGLKTGNEHVYTLLAVGAESVSGDGSLSSTSPDASDWRLATGVALGGRTGGQRLPLDVDVGLWSWIQPGQPGVFLVPRVRGALGLRLGRHLTPFVGVDLNLGIPIEQGAQTAAFWGGYSPEASGGVSFWPGVFFGIRI